MAVDKSKIKRAAVYFRYSSDKKAQVQNSEARQRDNLRRYCASKQWDVVWIGGDEKTSGDKFKPKLMSLRKLIEERQLVADVLVVTSWDRLTRRGILDIAKDVEWIRDAGIYLCLQTEDEILDLSDQDTMFRLSIRAYEAHRYLKSLSASVVSGLEAKFRSNKLRWAKAPFGFDLDGTGDIIPNDDLRLVPGIFNTAIESGILNACQVMRNGSKYRKSGKIPPTASVKAVLRNTIYIGFRTFGITGAGNHNTIRKQKTKTTRNVNRKNESVLPVLDVRDKIKPVISEDVFTQVQFLLDENQKKLPKRKKTRYKFSSLVRCSCGAKLTGEMKVHHINYACPKSRNLKNGCNVDHIGRKTVRESEIEDWVKLLEVKVLRDVGLHKDVLNRLIRYIKKSRIAKTNTNSSLIDEIEELKTRRSRLYKLIADTGDESAEELINLLTKQIQQKESSLDKIDIRIDDLLRSAVSGANLDPSGRYLQAMLKLAESVVDLPETPEKSKAIQVGLATMLKTLIRGHEYRLGNFIDELKVHWRFIGGRNRPWKVTATWSITSKETLITATTNRGGSSNMGIRIAIYPSTKKATALLIKEHHP